MNAKAVLMLLGLNALISSGLVAVYARWGAPPPAPRLAVLDVGELYRLKESQVAAVLMQRDATDAARTAALTHASTFGTEVTTLLQALPEACGCVILTRGALVGDAQSLPDLTPDVRRRLGL